MIKAICLPSGAIATFETPTSLGMSSSVNVLVAATALVPSDAREQ